MSITPFRIAVSDERLGWIAGRVRSFPRTAMADAGGWSGGTSLSLMRSLADYWLEGYDWGDEEDKLNRHPQFLAEISGQQIHFLQVPSKGDRNDPLLSLHGWPGSIHEFEAVVDLLISPDDEGHAFTLVIPALPGYGFSRGLARPTGSRAMADIMAQLMRLLGYGSYVAQGGDLGAMVSTQLGIHDSPVGAAAWIVEKFAAWSDLPRNADGVPDLLSRYTREQLLTNIMFYVVPGSFATAAWLYHGLLRHPDDMPFAAGRRCTTPTGVAALPDPVSIPPPRSLAEKSHSIAHWTKMPSGGHFAAMEQPALLAEDVRHLSGSLGDPASLRLI